jgi:hypothetical protein
METVICRNKLTGKLAEFIPCRDAPKGKKYSPGGGPVYYDRNGIWCSDDDITHDWRYTFRKTWEERGWDLRPLDIIKNKPFPKAFLGYDTNNDKYRWFVHQKDCPPRSYYETPRRLDDPFYSDRLWKIRPDGTASHGTEDYWRSDGFMFLVKGEKAMKVEVSATYLQNLLIDYCSKKSSRLAHLKKLNELGALGGENHTYDEVKETILTYLNNRDNVCSEGAKQAKKALGLSEGKWVTKLMSVQDIYTSTTAEDVRLAYADGSRSIADITSVYGTSLSSLPSGTQIQVQVWEEEK